MVTQVHKVWSQVGVEAVHALSFVITHEEQRLIPSIEPVARVVIAVHSTHRGLLIIKDHVLRDREDKCFAVIVRLALIPACALHASIRTEDISACGLGHYENVSLWVH